jgi:hypothetical protein
MRRLTLLLAFALAVTGLVVPTIAQGADGPKKLNAFLYVDTVNGSSPAAGTPRRPISCTQTNTYARGEQIVFRAWGSDAETGAILSTENVDYAYVTFPGQPNLKMGWGAHGAASNRVWFWTAWLRIPADYPLGDGTARIVFKTDEGKFATYEFAFTVVPTLKTAQKAAIKTAKKKK